MEITEPDAALRPELPDASEPPPEDRPRAYDRVLAVCLALAVALLVAIRLGPSLLGMRVFAGLNLLSLFAPWSSLPTSHSLTTSIYVSDQLDATFPALHQIAQHFLHGDIAGWSSLVGGGAPLLATPDFSVLTPGRILYLVLPTWLAPAYGKLAEMAFAGIFCYLLVRRLRGSKLAGALAGFIYPLTGFMIAWTNWPHTTVASAIPMLFWSIERFVQDRRLRAAVPVALATALLLFGGFPAVAGQALYFGGGYALLRVFSEHRRQWRAAARDVVLLMVSVGVGIGLAAAQLLPFVKTTLTGSDLSYRDAGFFVHDGYRYLLNTVFPHSFSGNNLTGGASPMDLDAYLGSVVLLLAVLGLVQALSGRIRGAAGLYFVGMVLLIIGLLWFQGPWSNWMDKLPIFHGNPINRIRSQLGLPVAVLAAAGFDLLRGIRLSPGWWRRFDRRAPWLPALVSAGVTAVVIVAGVKLANPHLRGLAPNRKKDILLAVLPLLAITVLLVAAIRFRIARLLALVVVIFSVSVQALAATAFFWPTAPRSQFYPSTAGIRYLQQNLGHDRMATLGYALRPNATEYYGLRTLNGHAFFPKDLHQVLTGIDAGSFVGNTYSIFTPAVARVINSPGLGRMGVRYMVGEQNTVLPSSPNSALPILGAAEPMPAASATAELVPGRPQRTTIAGGALRGVYVPLTATAAKSTITVTVRSASGALVATNKRSVAAGTVALPIALADDPAPGQSAPAGPQTVEVSSDVAGVSVKTQQSGQVVLGPVRPSPADSRARVAFAGDNLVIYERLDYVPRIHWASHATVISDPVARLKAVTSSPLDPAGVILAADPPAPLAATSTAAPQLSVGEDSGDTVKVAVNTASAGMVVVSDSLVGNFDATVDGHAAPIQSADYAVGAIYVPAGSHRIALHYDPPGRKNGNRISAVSAVLVLAALVPPMWWGRLRRRRRRKEAAEAPLT